MIFNRVPRCVAATLIALGLSACGGSEDSSENSAANNKPTTDNIQTWVKGEFADAERFINQCSSNQTGTAFTEKMWLRSWSNDTYLWYDEIEDRNPATFSVEAYFDTLISDELSESGNKKDKFHFTMPTDEWEQLNQSGASVGYGLNFNLDNGSQSGSRKITVTYSDPNSPASLANIDRGAVIVEINGVNVQHANDSASIDIINAGLFPTQNGIQTTFSIRDFGASTSRAVTLTANTIVSTPVQNTKVIPTSTGNVGYLLFNSHIATAEQGLFDSLSQLAQANVDDLVIDLRYNGGGLVALASQLGYMIAGKEATDNRVFEKTIFNDKHTEYDPVTNEALQPIPFLSETLGFNPAALAAGIPLPSLNLSRVYVLTTASTCSASEALMNALRGIDVEVIQIGGTTCGKPYGFYPTANCGNTYFTIQFEGVNDKGFGQYSDGLIPSTSPTLDSEIPGCSLMDDFSHPLGDNNERLLSAALYYRDNQRCPMTTTSFSEVSRDTGFIDKGFMLKDNRKQTLWQQNRFTSAQRETR